MLNRSSLFRGLLQPWSRHAARQVIVGRRRSSDPAAGRFTRSDVDGVVSTAWVTFMDLCGDVPSQTKRGSRLNFRLACLTLAFFRALIEHGVARTYAVELTADLTWSFYKTWGTLRRLLKKGDPLGDLKRRSLEVVPLSFPFNPPAYFACGSPTSKAPFQGEDRCPFRWRPVHASR